MTFDGTEKELREAAQEFIDRCDRGEIRSTRTYNKFKSILGTSAMSHVDRHEKLQRIQSMDKPPVKNLVELIEQRQKYAIGLAYLAPEQENERAYIHEIVTTINDKIKLLLVL